MIRHRALQWTGIGAGLTALLAALLLAGALGSQVAAQSGSTPPTDVPAWFWGMGFDGDNGSMIRVINQDGKEVDSASIAGGRWSFLVSQSAASSVTFEIETGGAKRATESFQLAPVRGKPVEIKMSDFTTVAAPPPAETVGVRVIARVAPADSIRPGQVEFGLYVDGVDEPWAEVRVGDAEPMFLPPARFFPQPYPSHNRWLRSTLTDLGNGCAARVIARTAPADSIRPGQVEFGLYVDGVDEPWAEVRVGDAEPMFLPPARYFPSPHPDHNRWLRSTLTDIPCSGS